MAFPSVAAFFSQLQIPRPGRTLPFIQARIVETRPPVSRSRLLSSPIARPELLIIVAASSVLLLPCIWLPQVESFDLCSHIYNSWLFQLITHEHPPGLWIARQSTNILFDNLLTPLMAWLGPVVAQRIMVGASVLLLFWSSFVFISALSGRRPWFLLPCLGMLSYGRIFHYGFFNFYISLAFAFLSLSLIWKPFHGRVALFTLLLALSWAGHPLPALSALGAAGYIYIVRHASRRIQWASLGTVASLLLGIGVYERARFPNSVGPGTGPLRELLTAFGWDQILAFNHPFTLLSYRSVELGVLLVCVLLLMQAWRAEKDLFLGLPLHLYALACIAGFMLPDREFYFPGAGFQTPLGFIAERFSLVAAVLGCAVIARANPRPWQRALLIFLAAVFLAVQYRDERSLSQLEARVDQLVSTLPPGQRVTAMLHYPGAEDGFTEDIVDRACIGRCYSYGNYEAPTGQFRIRANPNNPIVLSDLAESDRLSVGTYRVQARDLPLHQIYTCGPSITDLCMRDLQAGELNGSVRYRPQ